MRRRGATLLAGVVILVVLVLMSWQVKVPYVELGPGPTWDTLGKDNGKDVISITGAPTTSSAGQLRMVTVGVRDELSLWEALRGWLSSDEAVVPREVVYPPNQTTQQVDQQNKQDFQDSQSSAETVALRELGYPVKVDVTKVADGAPAQGHLQNGDVITSVNGQPVISRQRLLELIKEKPAGTPLVFGYTRAGVAGTTTISAKNDQGTPRVGIEVDQQQPSPIKVNISLAGVGGPSAGLMFTLGIIDKVQPADLTGGLHIAGTGTIDDDGTVGPIGGIAEKLRGAKADTATVFLVPAANCAEAVANQVPGLELVKVGTVTDALSALTTLRAKGTPTLCTAK